MIIVNSLYATNMVVHALIDVGETFSDNTIKENHV